MPGKTFLSRAEFERFRIDKALSMNKDRQLLERARNVLVDADHYYWIHQANWFGEPTLNLPQDMFALQEIIFKTRPKFIIELGVAWGGSLLFYATLMKVLGGKRVIGIDIYVPDDLRQRLAGVTELSDKILLIQGSSIESEMVARIREKVTDCRETMVILDSNHTHDHVISELRLYSPLIGKGFYMVCGDTIIEDMPVQKDRTRPWGPGNNPKTAVIEFLKENDRFVIDESIDKKLLLTCMPGGFLKCIKDP
jgi:cephalosporin hydroxylase